jgi:hypothetical protein
MVVESQVGDNDPSAASTIFEHVSASRLLKVGRLSPPFIRIRAPEESLEDVYAPPPPVCVHYESWNEELGVADWLNKFGAQPHGFTALLGPPFFTNAHACNAFQSDDRSAGLALLNTLSSSNSMLQPLRPRVSTFHMGCVN